MTISDKQRRWLKKRVHHLKPVVTLGQRGITDAFLAEMDLALERHELIKIRVNAGDRDERDALIGLIRERSHADFIHRIGNLAAFYRANPRKPDPIPLPDL